MIQRAQTNKKKLGIEDSILLSIENICHYGISFKVFKEENFIHCPIVKVNAGQSTLQTKKYLDYNKRLKNLLTSPHPTLIREIVGVALNL